MTINLIENRKNRSVFIKINNLKPIHHKAIREALFEIGKENVRHARMLMEEPKTGRLYKIGGSLHRASAPGEVPAKLSGDLSRSLDYTVRGHQQMEFGDKTQQSKAPYGKYLEEGTSKMEARPHIERTVRDKNKDTQVALQKSVNRFL